MEKLLLLNALLITLLVKLCSTTGAFVQPSSIQNYQRFKTLDTILQEYGQQQNQDQYVTNVETIMKLLAGRNAQKAEWRQNEAVERGNLVADLSARKRGFNYYGSRGKKSVVFEQQERFKYFPSRGK